MSSFGELYMKLSACRQKGSEMIQKVQIPKLPLEGGCQCGAVRYKLHSAPLGIYICHCTECQKQSSSGFGESCRVNASDLEFSGEVSTWSRTATSGSTVNCEFCPKCGSRLFHRRAEYAETLNIKAGSFDDTSWIEPAGHIWTKSKQSWVTIPDEALTYSGQPVNFDALNARWREMIGA